MKAHELLSDINKWTCHAMARNAAGTPCSPTSDAAVQWCAIGAILKCYPGPASYRQQDKAQAVAGYDLFGLNDKQGYDRIIEVLRKADV